MVCLWPSLNPDHKFLLLLLLLPPTKINWIGKWTRMNNNTYFKHIGTEKETETENSIYSKWKKTNKLRYHKLNHPFLSFPFHIFLLSKNNNNNNRPNFWSNNNHTLLVVTANYYYYYYSLEFARLLFISYSPPRLL